MFQHQTQKGFFTRFRLENTENGGSREAGGDPWETWEGRKARPHSTHSVRREAGEVGKDRRIVPETLVCSGPEASGGFRVQRASKAFRSYLHTTQRSAAVKLTVAMQ